MSKLAVDVKESLSQLHQSLITTLNEFLFFSELTKFLKEKLGEEHVIIFKVFPDQTIQQVSHNGQSFENAPRIKDGAGLAAQVALTKRPYYSNAASRDPLFSKNLYKHKVEAECVIPMMIENTVVATLHLQSEKSDRNFKLDDIHLINAYLQEINRPLVNLHMYLAVKNLNEVLLEKIKEREIESSSQIAQSPFVKIIKEMGPRELFDNQAEFLKLKEMARKLSMNPLDMLIIGENGTGKHSLMKAVHQMSGRDDRPLVVLSCRPLVDSFLQQDQASFDMTRLLFETYRSAEKGTLVIENVEALPLLLQARLNDFLQMNESEKYRSIVRTIYLSEPLLEEKVLRSQFDRGLFNNMHGALIRLPSLSKRTKEEMLALAQFFLNRGKNGEKRGLAVEAQELLMQYPWPGNMAELQKVMESAAIMSTDGDILSSHLPDMLHRHLDDIKRLKESEEFLTLEKIERDHICETLQRLDGNKTRAAKVLGITVKTLYNKLHLYSMI